MRINSFKIIAPLVLALSTSNAMANNTSGKITFKGEILSSSCNIVDNNIKVTLPKIDKKNLSKINTIPDSKTYAKEFDIVLEDCGNDNKNVEITLKSTNLVDGRNYIMRNMLTGNNAANDVGITIYSNETNKKNSIALDGKMQLKQEIKNNKMVYKLAASYVAIGENIKSGVIETQATFDIVYK